MEECLRIGKINYLNLFPIFYALENRHDCSAYRFVEGVPSALNRLLAAGEIDISPSSSIEYLRHKDRYNIIEGHSISSSGPIGSILLFSTIPIEGLGGSTILVSAQSETSVALLDIILKKFYSAVCRLTVSDAPLSQALMSEHAYLLIGDDALKAAASCGIAAQEKNSSHITRRQSHLYIYDLGDIWFRITGLPFVFALWIARKNCCTANPLLFVKFKRALDDSKTFALNNLNSLVQKLPATEALPADKIIAYWQNISYDLNDEHKKGLELFGRYAEEL